MNGDAMSAAESLRCAVAAGETAAPAEALPRSYAGYYWFGAQTCFVLGWATFWACALSHVAAVVLLVPSAMMLLGVLLIPVARAMHPPLAPTKQ
jgi:hypothetical protein